MPGKDVADFVGDALRSLTRQFDEPDDLEVIFIDDGSSDGSLGIVESYSGHFSNFQPIRNERSRGLAAARNQGMQAARGRFVSFLDADDWLAPGHLASLARDIEGIGCDFVRTDMVFTLDGVRSVKRAPQACRGITLDPRESILPFDRATMVDHPFAPAGLYDRRLVDSGLLRFNEELTTAEDRPWIWRLHLKARSFAVVDSPGYLYRRGVADSLTQILDERRLAYLQAFDEVRVMVEEDAETDRFMPKVVRTVLAITAHHLDSYDLMAHDVRTKLVEGARALLGAFPPESLDAELARMAPERAERLVPVLGKTNVRKVRR